MLRSYSLVDVLAEGSWPVPKKSTITEWSMTRSTGLSGLIFSGSPPSLARASRMAARSTTAGTPVKSCISTRAGRKLISCWVAPLVFDPGGDGLEVVLADRGRRPRCAAGSPAAPSWRPAGAKCRQGRLLRRRRGCSRHRSCSPTVRSRRVFRLSMRRHGGSSFSVSGPSENRFGGSRADRSGHTASVPRGAIPVRPRLS